MAMPTHLQRELDQLRRAEPGTRVWWGARVAITVGLLNGPLLALGGDRGPWGHLLGLAALILALLSWPLAARIFASERRRIEGRASRGRFGNWRLALAGATAASTVVLTMRPNPFLQTHVQPFAVFVVLVLLLEQALAAKAASFDLLEAREQALRAKLAPHFIFNTLNTLHAQIERDPRGAQATTERLAALFRQVIEAADQATVPLKRELGFVEAYLGIEQARLGDRLKVVVEVPEDLEASRIPPLSLQVLVENAVKHGVAPLEGGGEVRIGAAREGEAVRLWVEDPGTGVSPQKGTGTALETLRQRLERPEDLELGLVDGRHRAAFRWRQA